MAEETGELVNPLKLFLQLEEKMADDALLVVDGGDFVATASYILRPRGPLKWLDPGVFERTSYMKTLHSYVPSG